MNGKRAQYLVTFPNGKTWPVDGTYATARVAVDLSDLIDKDLEGFLDHLAEEAVGDIRFNDIAYSVVGTADGQVLIEARGDVSDLLSEENEKVVVVEVTGKDADIASLGALYHWTPDAVAHAAGTRDVEYEDEAVLQLANGREIRCPAYPNDCTYLRIVQDGHELQYWNIDEVAEDPADVLGAVVGAAMGSQPTDAVEAKAGAPKKKATSRRGLKR